jgi:hypothetical protein
LKSFWIFGDVYTVKISGDETRGRYSVWEIEVASNNGPPLHKHLMEDEAFYVLEGDFSFPYGSKETRISKGQVIYIPQETNFTRTRILAALLERLPPLNYRISTDYGRVEIAKSTTSQSDDLFGSTMNICAKINSKAAHNGVVMGNGLYQIVRKSFVEDYLFEKVGDYQIGFNAQYPIYSVMSKQKRNILNPFKQRSIS